MIYNFLSVYGIYYPSGTIETRAKWRIIVKYISLMEVCPKEAARITKKSTLYESVLTSL